MDRERARELDVYRRAFNMIDADRSGTVEPGEIMTMLRKMGRAPEGSKFWETSALPRPSSSAADVGWVPPWFFDVAADHLWLLRFNALDEDGSAELDFAEFTAIMDTCAATVSELRGGSDQARL